MVGEKVSVWLNGELVVDQGEFTGKLPGRALRKA
jgi:N-acyl-D-aspartate/D-glutamate deacylase